MKPQPFDKWDREHSVLKGWEAIDAAFEWLKQELESIDDPEVIARHGKTFEERNAIFRYVTQWKQFIMRSRIDEAMGKEEG